MPRVSIRYQNGSTVEANNLGDALVHLATNGTDYVQDVIEQAAPLKPCKHCDGTGRASRPLPPRVLSRKQAQDKVAQVNEHAPVSVSSFDERVKVARSLARD